MAGFISELKRRNVVRVGVAYLVIAWLLLQVADTLTSALNLPDWVTQSVIVLLLLGFVLALVFAWAFEITPDGVVRTGKFESGQPAIAQATRRLDYVTIAAVVIAVILLAWAKFGAEPDGPADPLVNDASVAVLPFVNLSANEVNDYFSDGLTETVLHMLAQTPNLRVVARTSSFAFKNKEMDIRDIAGDLGVAHVLEGSVQQVGDHIRITAQLIRASDGTHLWSEKYDRQLVDIFAIHDEIALAVGSQLSKSLIGNADSTVPKGLATRNLDALDLYLRALPEYATGSFESLQNAEALLKNALIKDPNFTDARIKLAETYVIQFDTGIIPFETGLANATALFEQALAERPNDATAQAHLAFIEMYTARDNGDLGASIDGEEQLRTIVRGAPNNVSARMLLANTLRGQHRLDEAIEQLKIAISLDPLNPIPHYHLAHIYDDSRQWDAARNEYNRSLEIQPRQPSTVRELAEIDLSTGKPVDFIQEMLKVVDMDPLDHEMPFQIAEFLYELELIEQGDRFAAQVMAIAPNSPAAEALRIVRSIRADHEDESLAVARRIIRDDADDRLQAWSRAFSHLMLTAFLRHRTADEFAFIDEQVPDFADFDKRDVPWKVRSARSHTLEIWTGLDTRQGLQNRVNSILAVFTELRIPIARFPIVNIDILLLQGQQEAAVSAALADLFSDSVLDHLNIRDRFVTPLYADFVADPRIAAALDRWNEEAATAREDVRQYLASSE